MLRAQGLDDRSALPLPDHHDFDTLPWPADAGDVVVTEKDAVKLGPARLRDTRVWVAPLDFELDPGFAAALQRAAAAQLDADDAMDHRLLELLVCPLCKGPLEALRDAGSAQRAASARPTAWPSRCATASR